MYKITWVTHTGEMRVSVDTEENVDFCLVIALRMGFYVTVEAV